MFDRYSISCPECSHKIKDRITPPADYTCSNCGKAFKVMGDPASSLAVFVLTEEDIHANPLFLPKGSIRALVTILVSACAWIMIFRDMVVPGYVFNLLLGIIGYYFAYRKAAKAAGSYIFEKNEKKEEPLFLPHGFIRFFLISGFLAVSGFLLLMGRSLDSSFSQFLVLLWGLILGYFFSLLAKRTVGGKLNSLLNHLKGLVVILAAVALFLLLLTNYHIHGSNSTCLFLAAVVSFYFGSKT